MTDDKAHRSETSCPVLRVEDAALREWLRRDLQDRYGETASQQLPDRLLALLPSR